MSDTFYHASDAYEGMLEEDADERFVHPPDPLFYHGRITFSKIVAETEKSYLFEIKKTGNKYWIPKKICKNFNADKQQVFVHLPTFKKIVERTKEAFL